MSPSRSRNDSRAVSATSRVGPKTLQKCAMSDLPVLSMGVENGQRMLDKINEASSASSLEFSSLRSRAAVKLDGSLFQFNEGIRLKRKLEVEAAEALKQAEAARLKQAEAERKAQRRSLGLCAFSSCKQKFNQRCLHGMCGKCCKERMGSCGRHDR